MGQQPTVVVLHGAGSRKPPGMRAVEERARVRYAHATRLADELNGADVLFVWDVRADVLLRAWPKADALRWMHLATAGAPPALLAEAADSDIVITSSRGVFDEPTAEYVLALVLAFAKDLPATLRSPGPSGRLPGAGRARVTAERVAGKRVLIAGSGPIARAIGRKLAAVGMAVTGIGRHGRAADPDLGTVLPMDRLLETLRHTDYLVLATPVTDETRGMIGATALAAMKPTARLINVSRGALVVRDDLIAALRGGRLAGAALDLFADEPLPESSPLWELPNVLLSAHTSGDVTGWREELVALFAENLDRYVAGRPLRNVVALPGR